MALQLSTIKGFLLDLFFPARCVGCGGEGSFLCPGCRDALPRVAPPFCHRCGVPLTDSAICGNCVATEWAIDSIRAAFLFQGTIRSAIHALKYRGVSSLAPVLGQLLADFLIEYPIASDLIVPVPLHSRRLRQRGYDQAVLLAEVLRERLGIPLARDALIRQRHTPSQARTKGALERRRNVEGAFSATLGRCEGQGVILIDDVCTTGATMNACALALKEAGAHQVWGVALARET